MKGLNFGTNNSQNKKWLQAGTNEGFIFEGLQVKEGLQKNYYVAVFSKDENGTPRIKERRIEPLYAGYKGEFKTNESLGNTVKDHCMIWSTFAQALCGEETGQYIFQLYEGLLGINDKSLAIEGYQGKNIFDFELEERQTVLDAFYEFVVENLNTCVQEKVGTVGSLLLHYTKYINKDKKETWFLNIPARSWEYQSGYDEYQSFFYPGNVAFNLSCKKLVLNNPNEKKQEIVSDALDTIEDDNVPF